MTDMMRTDITTLNGTYAYAEIRNGKVVRLEMQRQPKDSPLSAVDIERLIDELQEVKRVAYPDYVNASTTNVQVDMRDRDASHWTDAQGT